MKADRNIKYILLELDRQFDQETSIGGLETWVSYFAENGVMVASQGEDIKGREAIYHAMIKSFSLPGFSLRWEPIDAEVSEDGSMGYTYGKYVRKYTNDKGSEITSTGKYTTVWQKQRDTSYKIILDIGN
jgi:ketosteroid isomerase-like protein